MIPCEGPCECTGWCHRDEIGYTLDDDSPDIVLSEKDFEAFLLQLTISSEPTQTLRDLLAPMPNV